MAIERHALRAINGNPLAVPQILVHLEGVRTRFGKCRTAEGEVDRSAVLPSPRNSVGIIRQLDHVVFNGGLCRVIGREQLKPEGLVWKHVAPGKGLGARRKVLGGNDHGFRRIRIAEGCERLGRGSLAPRRQAGRPQSEPQPAHCRLSRL